MDNNVANLFSAIRGYYERTWFDYRSVWLNHDNLAFHFGYYGKGIRSHREALLHTNQTLASLAAIRESEDVLDAGCGLGGSAFWLAQNVGARVVGANIVPHQVQLARAIAVKKGLSDKVQFHAIDYANTEWPDASFDVVWALESLCHAPNKHAFYREAYRLLRRGGRLIVAEYMLLDAPRSSRDARLLSDWLQGWFMPNLYAAPQHTDAATTAGFEDVCVMDYTRVVHRSLLRLFALSLLAALPNEALYRLGWRCTVQHGNVIASLRQYQALSRSLWFYGLLRGIKR